MPLSVRRTCFLIAAATALALFDPRVVHATCIETRHAVPPVRLQAMARGFNLAGQLDTAASPLMHPELLRRLHRQGMRYIRLPVPAEAVMPQFSGGGAIERRLQDVNRVVREVTELGYAVMVDLHPGAQFNALHRNNPATAMTALKAAWSSLARVIGRFPPDRVFAELLNEPDVSPERWNTEVRQLAAFVRRQLPDTTLIVGPVNWQRADSLPLFQPLDDLNVVYALHFYDPMAFTHQGHWDANDPLSDIRNLPFPVVKDDGVVTGLRAKLQAEQKQRALRELDAAISLSEGGDVVARQLEPALKWQARYRRPLIINEFGVLKHHAPAMSRTAWIRSVVRFAEANCIGWGHWEFAQGFGLLNDKRELDEPTVRALLGD
jgi:endoglucanase